MMSMGASAVIASDVGSVSLLLLLGLSSRLMVE